MPNVVYVRYASACRDVSLQEPLGILRQLSEQTLPALTHECSSAGARPSSAAPVPQNPLDRKHKRSSAGARPSSAAPVDQKPQPLTHECSSVGARPSSAAPVHRTLLTVHTNALLSERVRPRPPPSHRTLQLGHGATPTQNDVVRPRTDAVREKSIRVLGVEGSVGRGRPRTDALRQKSFRVSGEEGTVRRGRPRTDELRQKSVRVLGLMTSVRRGDRRVQIHLDGSCKETSRQDRRISDI